MLLLLLVGIFVDIVSGECPRRCECKWKSGKESVVCAGANLSSVPAQLDAGTQILDLSSNHLLTMLRSDEFSTAGLLNLQKVFAARCRLRSIDRHAFRHLSNLVELDLSHNALTTVPTHALAAIPELRDLRLSGNPIGRLADNAFAHLSQLVRLELNSCRIASIEKGAFAGLERTLEWLKLDGNRVSVLDAAVLSSLANLHGLELAGNPWNCSCALRPLRAWMMRSNVPFGVPPVCRHPRRLAARAWNRLDLDEFACAPAIFAHDATAYGVEGRNVTMACGVSGVPLPHVRWMLRNRVIANLSGASLRHGRLQYVVQLLNTTSDLTILAADAQDAGVYVCAAENKAGRVEASVTLAVSRRSTSDPFTEGRTLLVAAVVVVVGVLFVLGACVLAAGAFAVRRRRAGGRRRHADDDYEKIELGARILASGRDVSNGRAHIERSEAPPTINGDYRVVPVTAEEEEDDEDDDDDEVEDDEDRERLFWQTPLRDTWIEPQWDDLHIPRRGNAQRTIHQRDEAIAQLPSTSRKTASSDHLSSLLENDEKTYPDLIENNNNNNNNNNNSSTNNNNNNKCGSSESGGSVRDIREVLGSLPRTRTTSSLLPSDSQSPLLMDSRSTRPIRETPLLDVTALETRIAIAHDTPLNNAPPPTTTNLNAYDYHAAQLERFLEEYRTLQKELARMKETCDNMRQAKGTEPTTSSDLSRYLLKSSPKSTVNNASGLFNN